MLKVKISLFLFSLGVCCAWAAVLENSSEQLDSLELLKIEPLSSEEAALVPKANWLPICQGVVNNKCEQMPIESQTESDVILLPQEIPEIALSSPIKSMGPTCKTPNDDGYAAFFRKSLNSQAGNHLTAFQQSIVLDPEFQKFSNLTKTEKFPKQLEALAKTNAFVVFRDFACHVLNLDIDDLLLLETKSDNLCQGLAIVYLKNLFDNKLKKSERLENPNHTITKTQFFQILVAVENQPEYIELMKELKQNEFKLSKLLQKYL